jgi:SulP family sulfate permease
MALAIAVGVPPQHGLYTAIVAGAAVALLGGCRFQVTGPTAAFIVILAPIVTEHGLAGLLTAGFMAGLLLLGMGVARLGRLIQYIPHPVTTGFTTGIATVIATLQLKDVFGLQVAAMPESYVEKLHVLWAAKGTASVLEFGAAAVTFALLLSVPKLTRRVPAPLVAIVVVASAAALLRHWDANLAIATIGDRFHAHVNGVEVAGVPNVVPSPGLPWHEFSFDLVAHLMPAAFAIAVLGAIESLLSAVIADGMTGTRHDPDTELVALGVGNVLAPLFGGIAATGALARTATNIRAGAKSPIAAFVHSGVVLACMLLFGPLVAYVPMASLAALLLLVAWNMSELRHFVGVVRTAPRSDVLVLTTCYVLTVVFDMVTAVSVGVVLAALLFMRRMADLTQGRVVLEQDEESNERELPDGVALYEINGPLFFGASQKAMEAIHAIRGDTFQVMVLNLGKVPVMDSTGLVALENAVAALRRRKKRVVLAGPLPEPRKNWERAWAKEKSDGIKLAPDLPTAVAWAGELVREAASSSSSRSAHAGA